MLTLSPFGLGTAFLAGLLSFLSPCVLPLVPGYLSYVAGTSLEELRDRREGRWRALPRAACFVLGFGLVFMALGAGASAIGSLLLAWRYELGLIAGAVVLVFGLHMLGLSPFGLLAREARIDPRLPGGPGGAVVLGAAFAFGWTPCIGPVLGTILTMSATAGTAGGVVLLGAYTLGLGLPFLLAACFTGALLSWRRGLGRAGRAMQRLGGALLVGMGLLLLTGQLERLAYWLLATFPGLATIG